MHKRKVLCIGIIVLLIILLIILSSCDKKIEVSYTLESENEKYIINIDYNKKIENGYFVNIFHNDKVYTYQFKHKYFGNKIVYNIKYYKDEEKECILPLFDGLGSIFDLKCNYDDYEMYYHNMEDDKNIDAFLANISGYKNEFNIESDIKKNYEQFEIYFGVFGRVFFESYKGLVLINDYDVKEVKLFKNDVYTKDLSVFTINYYMVPNYDEKYEFNTIYVIDLKNAKQKEIKLEKPISFSSYIQGIEYDIVYLFDLENKKQYAINVDELTVELKGNLEDDVSIYEDNEWQKVSVSEVIKKKPTFEFNNYRKKVNNNTYVDTIDNNIYTYVKSGDKYKAYLSSKYMPNIKNYLFDIDNIDSIQYFDGTILFKNEDYIASYNVFEGKRKIIQSNELLFNKDIDYKI